MPDNYRSDADTGNTSHMIDTKALGFGTTSSDNSQAEDREANMYLPRDQNEPATLAPNVERTAAQPFYVNEQPDGAALGPQNDSSYHIEVLLRGKTDELAAAENTVSKLLVEIKMLEESLASRGDQNLEATPKSNNCHKRGTDETLRGAKRLKGKGTALGFDSQVSKNPSANGEETLCPTGGSLSTSNGPLPLGRAHHPFSQYNEIVSGYTAIHAISNSEAPTPCLAEAVQDVGQPLSRTFNNTNPRVDLHAERSTTAQSSLKYTPWSQLLTESTNAFSSDSRYTSLDIGFSKCRGSSKDGFEESIAWVA